MDWTAADEEAYAFLKKRIGDCNFANGVRVAETERRTRAVVDCGDVNAVFVAAWKMFPGISTRDLPGPIVLNNYRFWLEVRIGGCSCMSDGSFLLIDLQRVPRAAFIFVR